MEERRIGRGGFKEAVTKISEPFQAVGLTFERGSQKVMAGIGERMSRLATAEDSAIGKENLYLLIAAGGTVSILGSIAEVTLFRGVHITRLLPFPLDGMVFIVGLTGGWAALGGASFWILEQAKKSRGE